MTLVMFEVFLIHPIKQKQNLAKKKNSTHHSRINIKQMCNRE